MFLDAILVLLIVIHLIFNISFIIFSLTDEHGFNLIKSIAEYPIKELVSDLGGSIRLKHILMGLLIGFIGIYFFLVVIFYKVFGWIGEIEIYKKRK